MNLTRIYGVFLRYFYTSLKGPHQLTDLFYWPFVDILLWGLTSVWIKTQSNVSSLPLILITGLIFWQVAWRGSIDISINILQEIWHRNLVNMFSTPLKLSEWVTASILLCLCKLAISLSFASLMVYLLYSLNVYNIGWVFIPMAALLLVFGWSVGFVASGLVVYWGHQVEMLVWMIGFFFAPFSGVFYPVATLPAWAQKISWCLPTTYIFEGMRRILETGEFPLNYFLTSLGLNIIFITCAVLFFRFMFEKSRMKGLARHE